MSKTIRLTESELISVIEKVVDKSDINENFIKNLLYRLFKSGSKTATKMTLPLIDQLPSKVRLLIQSFPKKVKVGDKLQNFFNTHANDIKSLDGYIKRQGIGAGSDVYSSSLAKAISTPKGGIVNLQNIYSDAQMLKKTLENIKAAIPKPKVGSTLNKNPNYKKQMTDLYNKFYTETATLNRIISDLEKIKPIAKPMVKPR